MWPGDRMAALKRIFRTNKRAWLWLREEVIRRAKWTCAGCGKRSGYLEVDHIVPVSQGGSETEFDNLQALCRDCHMDKTMRERGTLPAHIRELREWRTYRESLKESPKQQQQLELL